MQAIVWEFFLTLKSKSCRIFDVKLLDSGQQSVICNFFQTLKRKAAEFDLTKLDNMLFFGNFSRQLKKLQNSMYLLGSRLFFGDFLTRKATKFDVTTVLGCAD